MFLSCSVFILGKGYIIIKSTSKEGEVKHVLDKINDFLME